MNKISISKEVLNQKYVIERKSTNTIAKELGCGVTTIKRRLEEFKIPIRIHKYKTGYKLYDNDYDELIGKRINFLTILKYSKGFYICRCDCGKETKVVPYTLISGSRISCGCRIVVPSTYSGKKNYNWKGYEDLPNATFWRIQHRATIKHLQFDLTKQYLWELFISQNKKCAITNVQLQFGIRGKSGQEETASLDRIDSSKGYIIGNVQWVHKIVNQMKWNLSQQDFINWCKLIVDHQKPVAK